MARNFQFKEATREGHVLKMALWGPSGAGKTYSALKIAYELTDGGNVGVIDTENGSSGLYADMADDQMRNPTMRKGWRFQSLEFGAPYDPRELTQLLNKYSSEFDALIVDSASAFWNQEGGLLEIVEQAGARVKGNNFAGWKVGTPIQEALKEAILRSKCHIILCMRAKTAFEISRDDRGKSKVEKLGLGPIQRDTTIYEMTIGAEIDADHKMHVDKSRCSAVADKTYSPNSSTSKIEEFAREIKSWLGTAEADKAESDMEQMLEASRNLDDEGNLVSAETAATSEQPLASAPGAAQVQEPAESAPTLDNNDGIDIEALIDEITPLAKKNLPVWQEVCKDNGFSKLKDIRSDGAKVQAVRDDFIGRLGNI